MASGFAEAGKRRRHRGERDRHECEVLVIVSFTPR
jgi:hypothetical protein